MKVRFIFVLALVIPFLFSCGGGSSSDISTVKNGTLLVDKSVTLGNAFDGYKLFTKKEWKSLSDPQKRRIVEFSGTIDMPTIVGKCKAAAEKNKHLGKTNIFQNEYDGVAKVNDNVNECTYYAQFFIAQDGKSFSLNQSGIRFTLKDGKSHEGKFDESEASDLISKIYKNDEFAFGYNIYFQSPFFNKNFL